MSVYHFVEGGISLLLAVVSKSLIPTCCTVIEYCVCNIVAWKTYNFKFSNVLQLRPVDGLKYKLKHVV